MLMLRLILSVFSKLLRFNIMRRILMLDFVANLEILFSQCRDYYFGQVGCQCCRFRVKHVRPNPEQSLWEVCFVSSGFPLSSSILKMSSFLTSKQLKSNKCFSILTYLLEKNIDQEDMLELISQSVPD